MVRCRGSPKARVNPLHIMPIPKIDEPDETEPGLTDYYDKDEGMVLET